MNIHINESQFKELKKATLLSIRMGSVLYGCETSSSDQDFIHIFAHNEHFEKSFVWTHHNFQYKEEKVDHVFVSLKNFVINLIKGDSTINYECLFSEEMKNCRELSFLYDFRLHFNSYALIRAYLGLVRRDLKVFAQSHDSKKLYHAIRGLASAQMVINNNYDNNLSKDFNLYNLIMDIRNNKTSKKEMVSLMHKVSAECDALRKKVSADFQTKKISRLMNVSKMKELDDKIILTCLSEWYKEKMKHNLLADEVYLYLDQDISYSEN